MAFEGIKDRVRDAWTDTAAKIQESSVFNQLREKFEEQTPPVQRSISLGGIAVLALFCLSFPLGYLSTSGENVAQFEENRALIQGLLRAARSAKEPSPLPPPVNGAALRSTVERVVREKQISPDQLGEIMVLNGKPAPNFAPPAVEQSGVVANIKQLTLTQIVDLANAFANIGAGTKLMGLDVVQTAGQTHYYDINVKVVNFGLPTLNLEPDGPPARAGGGRPPPRRAAAPPPGAGSAADEGDEE